MAKKPLTDADRKRSAEAKAANARKHSARIDVAIANAVIEGANSLKSLAAILNRNGVRPRSAEEWSIQLVDHELARSGSKVKALRARVEQSSKSYGEVQYVGGRAETPTDWSEEAFWHVIEAERAVAERNGRWVSGLSHSPKKGDVVRHREHGEGHFHAVRGVALLCRFYLPTGLTPLVSVAPVEVEVFVWTISPEERDEIFLRIAQRYLTKDALVPSRSITVEQRQARRGATRWR